MRLGLIFHLSYCKAVKVLSNSFYTYLNDKNALYHRLAEIELFVKNGLKTKNRHNGSCSSRINGAFFLVFKGTICDRFLKFQF